MKAFQHISAKSMAEAQSAVGTNGRYLGGGIDLLAEMKEYIVSPEVLVNVKNIKNFIAPNPGSDNHVIGGLTRIADIEQDPEIIARFPGLSHAASEVGSPQIRNVATLAGNLLQHSRCWFYRQRDLSCFRKGGTGCPAQDGDNRYLALFTGCGCVSTVVSNLASMLTALDASVVVQVGEGKTKTFSMGELYAKAWTDPTAHHSLSSEQLLVAASIPLLRKRSVYLQQSEKREFDWALVSCAVAGNVESGKFTQMRVVLGAVAPVPYHSQDVTDFLEGKPANDETVSKAADMLLSKAKPLAENGYKVPLAHTLIRRSLLALAKPV